MNKTPKLDRALLASSPYAAILLGAFMMCSPKGEMTSNDYLVMSGGCYIAAVGTLLLIAKFTNREKNNHNQKQR